MKSTRKLSDGLACTKCTPLFGRKMSCVYRASLKILQFQGSKECSPSTSKSHVTKTKKEKTQPITTNQPQLTTLKKATLTNQPSLTKKAIFSEGWLAYAPPVSSLQAACGGTVAGLPVSFSSCDESLKVIMLILISSSKTTHNQQHQKKQLIYIIYIYVFSKGLKV